MRPVQLSDIEAAVCVLLSLPPPGRTYAMAEITAQAQIADRYRKKSGKAHPQYGSGSILSACASYRRAPRPAYIHGEYLACLQIITGALASCRHDQRL